MIDERGCVDEDHQSDIRISATQAINSPVANQGRTAYIRQSCGGLCGFRQISSAMERVILAGYDVAYAEELRASAVRVIAEMRAAAPSMPILKPQASQKARLFSNISAEEAAQYMRPVPR